MRAGLPATLLAALLAGCSGAAEPDGGAGGAGTPAGSAALAADGSSAPTELAVPEGFRVALDDEDRPVKGPDGQPLVAWDSTWVLTWEPVPGAEQYAVYVGTNEGSGATPRRTTEEPRLRLQAAAGTSPAERVETDRSAGLLFTSSQLLVAVSARAGEREGPRSPWFPVGDVPPDGVPLPTGAGHADH
ncbi:MAG: hypothetical protein M3P95_10525 [Actinomycetota bacterium]|nr:hypothetical protein [Actinomycetota bacterium]